MKKDERLYKACKAAFESWPEWKHEAAREFMERYKDQEEEPMRDPNRIPEYLAEFERVWKLLPDWRFGQLVCNILGDDPFYVEDDKSLEMLRAIK